MITTAVALNANAAQVSPVPTEKPVSVVLVHVAFVDGSGWRAVYDILTKERYEVLIVQPPGARRVKDGLASRLASLERSYEMKPETPRQPGEDVRTTGVCLPFLRRSRKGGPIKQGFGTPKCRQN